MLLLLPQGGYNRPALQIPCLPFGKARCTLALLYDERSSSKSTRRKNPCAMHTAPGGAKKIMLLRRMQVAIPLEDQSKLFSMNVLRKAPLCCKPPYCAILGRFVRIRTASVVQAGIFLCSAVKSLLGTRQGAPGFESIRPPSLRDTVRPGPSSL